MSMKIPYLDLEYMEIDEEDRLTERDALMLGVVREMNEEEASTDPRG